MDFTSCEKELSVFQKTYSHQSFESDTCNYKQVKCLYKKPSLIFSNETQFIRNKCKFNFQTMIAADRSVQL